jgi:hypothetical protein
MTKELLDSFTQRPRAQFSFDYDTRSDDPQPWCRCNAMIVQSALREQLLSSNDESGFATLNATKWEGVL